jgi:c-di-GMP-binding flagellar brake protein YcgR
MFFNSKKPEQPASGKPGSQPEHRRHYRVRGMLTQFSVHLKKDTGEYVKGDCVDLAVGGAGVLFPTEKDPKLAPGQVVELSIQAMSRPTSIKVRAEVRVVIPQEDGVRYGFLFRNTSALFAQMDAYYARYFNRRRHLRVLTDLAQKPAIRIVTPHGEVHTKIHDVAMGGIGMHITPEQARLLDGSESLEVFFKLPGEPAEVQCRCKVRQRTVFTKHVLLGLEFEYAGGIERFIQPLRRFIDARQAQIQQWNAAVAESRKTKP